MTKWIPSQGPEGAGSEVINLSEKIPLGPPKEQTGLTVPTGEKEKPPLPGWSEKVAQGILSGGFVSVSHSKGKQMITSVLYTDCIRCMQNNDH